jgi:pimeloyl-ACP methyl ester carboxylesterase
MELSPNSSYGKDPEAGNTIQVNGNTFYYETYGKGEDLLLIHGNGSSIAGLSFQIDYFRNLYRVIAIDTRGHGKSENNASELTYELMADDLLDILNQLKIIKVRIFGWSDGGIIALCMAMKASQQIHKLAVMGANTRPIAESGFEDDIPNLMKAIANAEEKIRESKNTEFWNRKLAQLFLLKNQPQIEWHELSAITCKTLILGGEFDTVKTHHTKQIQASIPNATLKIFEGESHYMPITNPEVLNAELEAFFA